MTHGLFVVERVGARALTLESQEAEAALREALGNPEGIVHALKDRANRAIVLASVLEAYAHSEVQAGRPVEDVAVILRWPAFNNSAVRTGPQGPGSEDGLRHPGSSQHGGAGADERGAGG